MNVLVYLVPMALALGLAGLAAFVWSLKHGQYDDIEGSALRMLSDDDISNPACDASVEIQVPHPAPSCRDVRDPVAVRSLTEAPRTSPR